MDLDNLFGKTDDLLAKARDDQEQREAHLCKSEWVGEVDSREEMSLTLQHILGPFPGQWGDRFGYVFHAEGSCDVVMWWTSGKPIADVGETVKVKATVVKHDLYEGRKQTVIARAKPVNEGIKRAAARRDAQAAEGEGGGDE